MDRMWSSGVRASEIMLAQVLTQLLVFFVQVGLLLMFGLIVFKLPLHGSDDDALTCVESDQRRMNHSLTSCCVSVFCCSSIVLLFTICILLGVTGMMFGLVIASKVSEERDAMQCALGSFFPALLLSGVMVRQRRLAHNGTRRGLTDPTCRCC
jgi:ABC-type Na+ efflux pump permease subunit